MLAQAFLTVLRAQSAGQEPEQGDQEGKKLGTRLRVQPSPSSLAQFKRQRSLSCP